MTNELRIAINKLYTTQETKDLLISQCDLIDEEHNLALKDVGLLNKELAYYKQVVSEMHIDNLQESINHSQHVKAYEAK
jgi:hypothetical protein